MKSASARVCVLVLGLMTGIRGAQETEPELRKLKSLSSEPLSVIQIGEQVKIVRKSELSSLKNEIEAKYREALRDYTRARDQAKKAKQEFVRSRPVKERLTVLAASVKTEEEAEKLRDRALNDYLVIKLNDGLKVIRKLELASFKAKADADYRLAVAKYNEARKAARKSRQKFSEPAPRKPAIQILASRLTSEEAANERMQALQRKDGKSKLRTGSKTKDRAKDRKNKDRKDEEVEDENSADL